MVKRTLLFIVGACLLHAALGCGMNNGPLSSTDEKLQGQWIAEKLNATGDRLLMTFDPANGQRLVTLVAVRSAGDTYQVTDGTYSVSGNRLNFTLSQIPSFDSPFAVSDTQLTLGTDVYYKVTGSLEGPQVGGQIQISQAAADESVSVNSVPPSAAGEVLVKYKNGTFGKIVIHEEEEETALTVQGAEVTLSDLAFSRLERHNRLVERTHRLIEQLNHPGGNGAALSLSGGAESEIEYAVPNIILKVQSPSDPTDSFFDEQWNLDILNITDAWGRLTGGLEGGSDVTVAVIDTGIVASHPDLAGRVLFDQGYDFVSDTINGQEADGDAPGGPDDDPTDPGDQNDLGLPGGDSWHGTHIAGIISAAIDNGAGIAGIAPSKVKILPIRAMGRGGNGTLFDVAQAINYAAKLPNIADCDFTSATIDGQTQYTVNAATCEFPADRPQADVINLSLGEAMTATQAGPLTEAINAAYAAGAVIIASAGNYHRGPGYCKNLDGSFSVDPACNFYPAALPNVLSVSAILPNGTFASSYSNYGQTTFVAAPGGGGGQGILSTVHTEVLGGYGELIGTSQAAAHVSAIAATVISQNPALNPGQVKEILRTTAIDLGTAGEDNYYGWGLVNTCGAILAAQGVSPSDASTLQISSDSVDFGPLGTTHTVVLTSTCGGAAISGLTATKSSESDWLTATISSGTTPSQLTLQVNRTGLSTGDYTATVTVNSAVGSQTIDVAMRVGSTSTSGGDAIDTLREQIEDFLNGTEGYENTVDVGEVIVLLVDSESGEARYYTRTDMTANYHFQFGGIVPGSYYVLGGIDENLDGTICAAGEDEGCFAYPNFANPEIIEVTATTRRNDLDLIY